MSINFFRQLISYAVNVVVRCDIQIENKFRPSPFFFCLLLNAFSDFGSVSQRNKKKRKNKLEKESGARRPGTSA